MSTAGQQRGLGRPWNPHRSPIEQLVEDIAVLWLLTGNGAADAARKRMGL